MSGAAGRLGSDHSSLAALVATVVLFVPLPLQSQDLPDGNSRGVRIIDAPAPALGTGASPGAKSLDIPGRPPLLTPAAPPQTPSLTPPVASVQPTPDLSPRIDEAVPVLPPALRPVPVPALPVARPNPTANLVPPAPGVPTLAPAPAIPSLSPLVSPGPYGGPKPSGPGDLADLPKPGGSRLNFDVIASEIKVPNPAGLAMHILPGQEIAAGSEVTFQVSSKKPGYLILVDVEATGKLIQIYPNPMSLRMPSGQEKSNFLRPGKPLRIPDHNNAYGGFNFIASPPAGTAMVVAILSDRPVQMVDLPDIPLSLLGSASAIDYLTKMAGELRIPDPSHSDRLEEPHWSFDAKFYAIR
jgi:hypothetical protein